MEDATRDFTGGACRENRGERNDHRELGNQGHGPPYQEFKGEVDSGG